MTEAEFTILEFLRCSPETYFTRKEIARRAVGRQLYQDNPHWADAGMASLLLQDLIEQNESGLYRLKQKQEC